MYRHTVEKASGTTRGSHLKLFNDGRYLLGFETKQQFETVLEIDIYNIDGSRVWSDRSSRSNEEAKERGSMKWIDKGNLIGIGDEKSMNIIFAN